MHPSTVTRLVAAMIVTCLIITTAVVVYAFRIHPAAPFATGPSFKPTGNVIGDLQQAPNMTEVEKIELAKKQVIVLRAMTVLYHRNNGHYPNALEELRKPRWQNGKPYIPGEILITPWGRLFVYDRWTDKPDGIPRVFCHDASGNIVTADPPPLP